MNSECDDSNGEQNFVGRQGVEVQERGTEDSSSSHNLNNVIDKKREDKEIQNQICKGLFGTSLKIGALILQPRL